MKAFVIAGTGSGIGKTTVTAAVIAALAARGLRVQSFKCGPDYIDPAHHARLTGRPAHNLDSWMLSHSTIRAIFRRAMRDADVAVVEGVMGLFDGVRGSDDSGSTAEIAKLLQLPVVLVVDASNAARSIAAVVKGFQMFDPEVRLLGVILNRPAGPAHVAMLEAALSSLGIPVIGWLPEMKEARLGERHLGLVTAAERSWSGEQVARMVEAAENYLKLNELLALAEAEGPAEACSETASTRTGIQVRIGVARDVAFSFYYQASLDALKAQGAELVEVSPLLDESLPEGLDALYLGGGYPELYADELSTNRSFIASLCKFAEDGHPIYGECGGLMYLTEELKTADGRRHRMAGMLPLAVEMLDRLHGFGYTEVEVVEECPVGPRGSHLRGHSFHYSRLTRVGAVKRHYRTQNMLSGTWDQEGYSAGSVFASYIHLNFAADAALARHFVQTAFQARRTRVLA